jgi:hypothetical protein
MRYVTATIGAVLIFVGCVVGCFVLTAFPPFQGMLNLQVGTVRLSIRNPIAFAGLPIGVFAAVHSFRSTLKRAARDDEKQRSEPLEPPEPE